MKAQVLLPKVFNFPFTYYSKVEVKVGDLVEVPFGTKKEKRGKIKTPKNRVMKYWGYNSTILYENEQIRGGG